MATITAIKPQKNKKRVNIFLDSKFGFGLDLENFAKLGLKNGQEISRKELRLILKKGEFQKILEKLLRFATIRPRSSKEIELWFTRKKTPPSIRPDLLTKLKNFELLDDAKFTNWWIDQRISFKPRGKKMLFFELRAKGIDKSIIEDALEKITVDEKKIARDLLKKNNYKWEKKGDKKRQKMSEFLARKGFSWDLIKEVVKEF